MIATILREHFRILADIVRWTALTLPLGPGRYRLKGGSPVSAIIYGYDHNISYAYCAGLAF